MPRTDTVSPPGCPAIRAICFDNLGLAKVLESSSDKGDLHVVARWGEPDPQRGILGASLSAEEYPVLAAARRNHAVELLDPSTGATLAETNVSVAPANEATADRKCSREVDRGQLAGIHLFRGENSGRRSFLTCTEEGTAVLQRICLKEAETGSHNYVAHDKLTDMAKQWSVCCTGSILCFRIDASEKYAAFGGDGVDVNLWNMDSQAKIWSAKAPHRDSTGLISPPHVTSSAFLGEDHRKLVVGTGHHQIRLYDVCSQRRPVLAINFLESPIKAVEADLDGYTVFVGNGNGDLAAFDMRTGKTFGNFKGRCSGSIRSVSRHPDLPVIAACGLDRYLRVFHVKTRQLLSRVFLKQQLVTVMFDRNHSKLSTSQRDSSMAAEASCIECHPTDLNGQQAQLIVGDESHTKKSKSTGHGKETSEQMIDCRDGELCSEAMEQSAHKKKLRKGMRGEKILKERRRKKRHLDNTPQTFNVLNEGFIV